MSLKSVNSLVIVFFWYSLFWTRDSSKVKYNKIANKFVLQDDGITSKFKGNDNDGIPVTKRRPVGNNVFYVVHCQ